MALLCGEFAGGELSWLEVADSGPPDVPIQVALSGTSDVRFGLIRSAPVTWRAECASAFDVGLIVADSFEWHTTGTSDFQFGFVPSAPINWHTACVSDVRFGFVVSQPVLWHAVGTSDTYWRIARLWDRLPRAYEIVTRPAEIREITRPIEIREVAR